MTNHRKRPRDPNQLAKAIIGIATQRLPQLKLSHYQPLT
jgi:hypothetical protein